MISRICSLKLTELIDEAKKLASLRNVHVVVRPSTAIVKCNDVVHQTILGVGSLVVNEAETHNGSRLLENMPCTLHASSWIDAIKPENTANMEVVTNGNVVVLHTFQGSTHNLSESDVYKLARRCICNELKVAGRVRIRGFIHTIDPNRAYLNVINGRYMDIDVTRLLLNGCSKHVLIEAWVNDVPLVVRKQRSPEMITIKELIDTCEGKGLILYAMIELSIMKAR